ncbi:hypothetical protein BH23ACI1_BH23ACI1_32230 [soil metagenome]|nr:hypothetical protein [Acidobacteriota bacterium]
MIDGLLALEGARVRRDRVELGPATRVRRVTHPLPSRYTARNVSIENTVPRASIENTARPVEGVRVMACGVPDDREPEVGDEMIVLGSDVTTPPRAR